MHRPVSATTLVAPFDLRVEQYPFPAELEVGAFVDRGPVDLNPAELLGRNLGLVGVAGEDARV